MSEARDITAAAEDQRESELAHEGHRRAELANEGSAKGIAAEEMNEREMAAEAARAFERANENPGKVLTAEDIEQNSWFAVAFDLPRGASAELAAATVRAAEDMGERATAWGNRASDPAEAERWLDLAELADTRAENAALAHHIAVARTAWQEPEFSRATIDTDPWTAVYLPVPAEAEPELLSSARSWANDLARYAEDGGALSQPLVNGENYTREQNIAAAYGRVVELDARLEVAREPMTAEAIARDPWNAVALEIPADASRDLLSLVVATAEDLRASFTARAFNEVGRDELAFEYRDQASMAEERQKDAETRLLWALEARLEQTAEDMPGQEKGRRRRRGDFHSPLLIARRGFEDAARAVDIVLGVITGYLVDEPELTPQQVHDLTRASDELDEDRAFQAGQYDKAAALDEANRLINHNRSPVHAGAGDEPSRADSVYERYPGLTHDDSRGDEGRAEEDRAFYDTGIERER
jgi:hypothetical protein